MNITKLLIVIVIALSFASSALYASDHMLELVPVRAKKTGKIITVVVATVRPGSAAEKAGIKEGMFVSSIQGMKVARKTEKELIEDTLRIKWPTNNILIIECSNRLFDKKAAQFHVKVSRPSNIETIAKL